MLLSDIYISGLEDIFSFMEQRTKEHWHVDYFLIYYRVIDSGREILSNKLLNYYSPPW